MVDLVDGPKCSACNKHSLGVVIERTPSYDTKPLCPPCYNTVFPLPENLRWKVVGQGEPTWCVPWRNRFHEIKPCVARTYPQGECDSCPVARHVMLKFNLVYRRAA